MVISSGCSAFDIWAVPSIEALAWWANASGFRAASRASHFAAFPRVDDGRDHDERWIEIVQNLNERGDGR